MSYPQSPKRSGNADSHSAIYLDRLLAVLLCRNDLSETFIFALRIARMEHQYGIDVMMVSGRNGEGSFEIGSFRRSCQSQRLGNLNR